MLNNARRFGSKIPLITIVNGSPRVNGNTAKLLKECARGVESVGGKVNYVALVKLNYKGCISCLQCQKPNPDPWCYIKDDLKPVFSSIKESDGLVMGSPIYCNYASSVFTSFFERLVYPSFNYKDFNYDMSKKLDVALFYTMGIDQNSCDQLLSNVVYGIKDRIQARFGSCQVVSLPRTVLSDSKFHEMSGMQNEKRKEVLKTVWPKYLKQVYNIGRRMGSKK